MTPLRELQLVELYRKGGPDAHRAICELVRGYQRRVYSICVRMVRNREDAGDLTQDVLLKLVENLNSYNGQSKLSTWVIRVTMNCCLSHLRKQKIREHKSLDAPVRRPPGTRMEPADVPVGMRGRSAGPAGGELLPAQGVEQTQLRSLVLQALESLDSDSRAILVLRDLQDLDYQQLAEALEIPIGTVKSRLFRARAALRQAIESRGGI